MDPALIETKRGLAVSLVTHQTDWVELTGSSTCLISSFELRTVHSSRIDQTDANQAPYFADFVSKQCLSKLENNALGCDKYWVNWVDGHGCTEWVAGTHYYFVICLIKNFKQMIFYIDSNGGTTSFVLSTNSSGFGYCAKCSNLDPTWLLCQSDGQWALRQGISITTGITWIDSNCATWNLTEKNWDSWVQGFVMTSSGCICKNLNNQ